MPLIEQISNLAVFARATAYRALTPFDSAYGKLTGQREFPPLWLRRHIGCPARRHFLEAAAAGARHLDEILPTRQFCSILDLGCGCGSIVPYLCRRLQTNGSYTGVDNHSGCLDWCREQFSSDPRLSFKSDENFFRAHPPLICDLILAKSLFTHLLPDRVTAYLQAARRALALDGLFVLSAFLFDSKVETPSLPYFDQDRRIRFRRRYRRQAAIGFDRDLFESFLTASGFRLLRGQYSFWPGLHYRISGQDLLICEPSTEAAPHPAA